jgi:hypothetical protein
MPEFSQDEEMTPTPPFRSSHYVPIYWVARAARLGMCFLLLVPMWAGTQSIPGQQRPTGSLPMGPRATDPMDDTPNPQTIEEEKTLRALNVARQKSMVADADRLVRLVNELNVEIARTNPDSLTPAQLHKVAEIEKLAHNVKDKMSTSVRGLPVYSQPHFPPR